MFKYFAFISYSSVDYAWGRRLQRKLEHYKMPSTLCSEKGWDRCPIKPVFFAPTDIQPGNLSEELKSRLRDSRHLIVICSPSSARSEWVANEIRFFHSLGRSGNIHLFIVEGLPDSPDPEQNCFNPVLKELGIPEILGANVYEKISRWPWLNRERAYVQLVTKLLDIEFDQIWQRHRRQKRAQMAAMVAVVSVIVCSMFLVHKYSQPFDVHLDVSECGPPAMSLPELKEIVATVCVEEEVKCDTISSLSDDAVFLNIPRKHMGKKVRVLITGGVDLLAKDTMMVLDRNMAVGICRNEAYYGAVRFRLYHPNKIMAGYRVRVGKYEVVTDSMGYVSLDVPLEAQMPAYPVSADIPLVDTILFMPNNSSTAIEVK